MSWFSAVVASSSLRLSEGVVAIREVVVSIVVPAISRSVVLFVDFGLEFVDRLLKFGYLVDGGRVGIRL